MSLFKLKEVVELQPLVGEFFHTGSRVICNPPPQDTDDDYIVLVGQGAIDYVKKILQENGWKLGGSFDPTSKNPFKYTTFVSYKKEEYNLILTHSQDYFESFKRATYLASHLNLLKKEDRVLLFEAVVRDNYPTKLKMSNKTRKAWPDLYFKAPPPFNFDIEAGNALIDPNPVLEDMIREARIEQEDAELEQLLLEQELDAERHAEFARDLELEEAAMAAVEEREAEQELERI